MINVRKRDSYETMDLWFQHILAGGTAGKYQELGVPMDIYEGGIMRATPLHEKGEGTGCYYKLRCYGCAAKEVATIPVVSVETGTLIP